METKHTATPWRVTEAGIIKEDCRDIGTGSGLLIGSVAGHPNSGFFPTDEEAAANAAFIVTACNVHEQLLAAAQAAEAVLAKQKWLDTSTDPEALALRQLRAAIAKATGSAA